MDVFKHLENVSTLGGTLVVTAFSSYSPEVGSREWCDSLKAKSKGDWDSNETAYLAKKVLFSINAD